MTTEGIDVRSVGNSMTLHETALVEAFNLKAAIEYQLKNCKYTAKLCITTVFPFSFIHHFIYPHLSGVLGMFSLWLKFCQPEMAKLICLLAIFHQGGLEKNADIRLICFISKWMGDGRCVHTVDLISIRKDMTLTVYRTSSLILTLTSWQHQI